MPNEIELLKLALADAISHTEERTRGRPTPGEIAYQNAMAALLKNLMGGE